MGFSSIQWTRISSRVTRLVSWRWSRSFFNLCGGAYAQQSQLTPEVGIVVTGDGSVNVPPNYAQIRIGVTSRTKTNSKLVVAIIAALKDAGIAENDIQTARFSIQPNYTPATARLPIQHRRTGSGAGECPANFGSKSILSSSASLPPGPAYRRACCHPVPPRTPLRCHRRENSSPQAK
jgi:hypothetical protein